MMGGWGDGFGLVASSLRSVVKQICQYVENGQGETDRPFILCAQSGQATVGVYIGQGLFNQGISNITDSSPSLPMQLCDKSYDSTHIFVTMTTSNGTFTSIQNAIKPWANAICLSFESSAKIPSSATFVTPLIRTNATSISPVKINATSTAIKLNSRAGCRTIQVEQGLGCPEMAVKCGISPADLTKYNPGSTFCSNLKARKLLLRHAT